MRKFPREDPAIALLRKWEIVKLAILFSCCFFLLVLLLHGPFLLFIFLLIYITNKEIITEEMILKYFYLSINHNNSPVMAKIIKSSFCGKPHLKTKATLSFRSDYFPPLDVFSSRKSRALHYICTRCHNGGAWGGEVEQRYRGLKFLFNYPYHSPFLQSTPPTWYLRAGTEWKFIFLLQNGLPNFSLCFQIPPLLQKLANPCLSL